MIRFFKYIAFRLIILILLLVILDLFFTAVFVNTNIVRNKVQFIFKNKNKKYDYIFLGSSRVEFHIDTDLIDNKTSKKSLNLGISGQDLPETFLMLKLLKDNSINAKRFFLQIDESDLKLEFNKRNLIGSSYFMPYINLNDNIQNHMSIYNVNFRHDAYFPFYRYIKYKPKIGYRELLLTLMKKERTNPFFIGLEQQFKQKDKSYKFVKNYTNSVLNEIKKYCIENKIQLTFYTSPYYNKKEGKEFDFFCEENNILNYSNTIKDIIFFKDLDHLNSLGAEKFTLSLIKKLDL